MRAIAAGTLAAILAFTAPDSAAPAPRATSAQPQPALSIGSPNGGRLDGGARLSESTHLRVVPYYAESNARWGLPALVGLLDRAARRVARHYSDAVLSVGDFSRKGGGGLDRHHSHESGRDADIGFYIQNAAKKPVLPVRFVAFTANGNAATMPGALFDDARNWALIEALVDDPDVRISHIFVAAHIRARLLRYAEQNGVSRTIRERAGEVMMQPRRAAHDDHFHVRIACPREQRGTCVEEAIVYQTRVKPPVMRARHRAGTEDRRAKSLPLLPFAPKDVGGVARAPTPSDEPNVADSIENVAGPAEVPRPLANGDLVDNVVR